MEVVRLSSFGRHNMCRCQRSASSIRHATSPNKVREYAEKRGINVAYCAEQFENEGSPVSTIVKGVKGVKGATAGEYSWELSVCLCQLVLSC
jgi:hypothetical protein